MKWSSLKLALISIICVSQVIIISFFLIYKNLNIILGSWSDNASLTIFLKTDTIESEKNQLTEFLKKNPNTQDVKIIDRNQAAKDFQNSIGQYATGLLSEDDMIDLIPESLELFPKASLNFEEKIVFLKTITDKLSQFSIVDESVSGLNWLKRFSKIDQFIKWLGITVFVVLLLAMGFLSALMIRVLIDDSKSEIEVLNLLGATRWSVYKLFLKDLSYTATLSILFSFIGSYGLFTFFKSSIKQQQIGLIIIEKISFLTLSESIVFIFVVFLFIFSCSLQSMTSSLKMLTQFTYD